MSNMRFSNNNSRGLFARGPGALLAVFTTAVILGCSTSDLLTVQAPNTVDVDAFDNPATATLQVNSVINDFECAHGSFIMGTALLTDELRDQSLANGNWNVDRRDNNFTAGLYGTSPCTQNTGIYTPMSTARAEGDAAIVRLNGWTATQANVTPTAFATLQAQANLYTAFAYTALGMSMCQAAFDLGPLVDQLGMFALAETRFTAALSAATTAGNANLQNAARLGRARVRLFQHNLAGAIADATPIPSTFVFNASTDASTGRRNNRIFASIFGRAATVEPSARNLTTENGQIDPRSATIQINPTTTDGLTNVVIPVKYNAATQAAGQAIPMPIARYAEAQLILAEAQIPTNPANTVAIINTMRASVSLNPYIGPATATALTNLIASERQRVLLFEGFRSFDVERLNLPLIPAVGTPHIKGGVYGATVCMPVPDIERLNNPSIDASQLISGVRGEFKVP
jgi:hypothetical protein